MRYVLILLMACGVACGDMRRVLLGMRDARVAGGGAELWTPEDLDGLSGWWDASDNDTLQLSGSSITNWLDKSGNSYHLSQTTTAQAPTKVTDGSLQHARFTATSDQSIGRTTWVGTNYLSQNTFIVGSMNAAAENVSRMVTQAGSTGNDYDAGNHYIMLHRDGTNNKIKTQYRSATAILDVTTNQLFLAETRQTSTTVGVAGNLILTLNATTNATSTVTSTTLRDMQRIRFGVVIETPLLYWDGYISEVIISPTNLSSENRQKLEGYLAHKWGLTGNLPSDHPYKSNPPTK